MVRSDRLDEPGAWHHVMNRGLSKRTLFESRADMRYFLSRIARAVRGGGIELHAFVVMMTHFHLLVRSPSGRLSEVMRQIQLDYVRRFNRQRHRDGPLVRGRFASKPVLSWAYRTTLVRYIDRNPVAAGICGAASEYPFGSAMRYEQPCGPPWLDRSWVESEVRAAMGKERYEPEDYGRVFGSGSGVDSGLVERRLASRESRDSLDDLLAATPEGMLAWMRWKARLADGTEPGMPVVAPECVDAAIREARDRGIELLLRAGRHDRLAEIHAGLLRALSGASFLEIGRRIGRSTSNANLLCMRYVERVVADEAFAQHAVTLGRRALDEQFGAYRAIPRPGPTVDRGRMDAVPYS